MAKAAGFKTFLAAGKESTYGTAVTVSEMIPFLTAGLNHDQKREYDKSNVGKAGYRRSYLLPAEHAFDISANLDYGALDLLIAAAFGSAGSPSLVTDLYGNTYSLSEDVAIALTLAGNLDAQDGTGLLHEWPGTKIEKLTIKGSSGGPVEITADVIAKYHYRTGDGNITNGKTDISGATLLSVPVTMFDDMTFYIADTADALAAGDAMVIGDFEIVIDNKLRRYMTNDSIDEPDRSEHREISFTITIPSYTADTFHDWRSAHTELQARLLFERSVSGVTDDYTNDIRLGKLQVTDFQNPVDGPGIIAPKVEFVCLRADEDNPTWATMTEEMEFYVVNGRSASPIA